MGLSRLENFLRSVRGNIIYVDPNSLDSTDSIENTGSALTRPFKTIQRALIEASRFSYLPGLNNDKFNNTTILLYPGDHIIDNRPGWIPISGTEFQLRNGSTSSDFNEFDLQTNFDITTDNNILYKFNSVKGGVIVPRGTSIVGYDLRKTKIRPKYVPDPEDDNIERASIFQLTGGCYIWQLSIFDADPNGKAYKNYTNDQFAANFSHHKLTTFEYADGVNTISIDDDNLTYSTNRTDLDIYYEKIGLAYGPASGRNIAPDYPSSSIDIQTRTDEFRIVGSRGAEVGITSIRSGNGTVLGISETITVTLDSALEGLEVDTPIRINGVSASGYNGQFIVGAVNNSTEIQYATAVLPTNPLPGSGGTLNIAVDTVTSASPYVFNCSLRSVYGMCGLHADGSLVTGFKSMVVAQFTGISLQKDNNAFVKFDETTGVYLESDKVENIYSDSLARYKPGYENFHIKASNNAFIQCVSIFAIGYANHFLGESGGDMSITNSNSNFGSTALVSKGFSDTKFNKDDVGYISHVIPPKHVESKEVTVEFEPIDIRKTISVGDVKKLYLANQTSESSPPSGIIEGYRIGAKKGETINFIYQSGSSSLTYSAEVSMTGTSLSSSDGPYEKSFSVAKIGLGNNIISNVITFTSDHTLKSGETIRVSSNTGELPGNLSSDKIYYAITREADGSLLSNQIKISASFSDAISGSSEVSIFSNETSDLKIVSRVSDKNSGDLGHPIQWDESEGQWYIRVVDYLNINDIPLTEVSPRTFIKRIPDTRSIEDTLYKFRYVIPKDSTVKSRPPVDGFIIQTSTDNPQTADEIDKQYSPTLTTKNLINSNQLRNTRFISFASYSAGNCTITTELPHNLSLGSRVEIRNIRSTNNSSGIFNLGYNGKFIVTEIISRKEFRYTLESNPGEFVNTTSIRTTDLPYFNSKSLPNSYYVYRSSTIQEYIESEQDGIYYLTVISASNSPSIPPFTDLKFSQPIKNLYSQIDKDNPVEDPESSQSFALSDPIGQVIVNNKEKSTTRDTLETLLADINFGKKINSIVSTGTNCTFTTEIDHGLNPITSISFNSVSDRGSGYGNGSSSPEILYNARLVSSSSDGSGATAAVRVNSLGQITDAEIMEGGSSYSVGDRLSVVGVATTSSFNQAFVTVSEVYNHVGDTIKLTGVSENNSEFNNSYVITGIGGSTIINADPLLPTPIVTVNSTDLQNSIINLTGKYIRYSSGEYSQTNKNLIITDSGYFPYVRIGQKIKINDGSNYREFVIKNISSESSTRVLTIDPADNNTTSFVNTTGGIILPLGYTSSDGENIENDEDRLISQYAGISTVTIDVPVSVTSSTIRLSNISNLGLKIGDYIQVNDEILRISSTVDGNPIQVFRGSLGTKKSIHPVGSLVRKIDPYPIEFRRYTILRASGHTFEYVGFGPGNYSNSLPERQDREKTEQEDLLAQSLRSEGGVNVYTGMNNDGDFYIGNKRVNPATGQEDVFDSPFQSLRGKESEVLNDEALNFVSTQEINVSKSIKVEGGTNGNLVSEFNGPVIFNEKITSNSSKGIEGNSLFLQGGEVISRKYTVGISTPVNPGNAGDVVFASEPSQGGTVGWVYTNNGSWERFGKISTNDTISEGQVGISINSSLLGLSHSINFISGGGINITGNYNPIGGSTDLTFSVVTSTFSNLFVTGISTFQGEAFFSSPVSLSDSLSSSGSISGDSVKGNSIEVTNTLSGSNANSAISLSKFTATNSNFTGNIILGNTLKETDTFIRVLSGDNNLAGIEAYGNANGLGYLFVGEDSGQGGGIFYNGDTSTVFAGSEVSDTVSFYRKNSGNNQTVFYYPSNSNDVTFLGTISVTGDINSSSDERLKSNVERIEGANDILSKIDGVGFTWKETNKKSYGVIAQQVEEVLPELVNEGEYKTVNYNGLIAVLIESVKNQQNRISELERKIESLTKD